MTLHPIAFFRSPLTTKFGIPRQSGIVDSLRGRVVFVPEYQNDDFLRGIDDFDYLWLLWGFSANAHPMRGTTVRPPLLGGNRRMGVLATRSPFRPNPIGLSSVRLVGVEQTANEGPVLHVAGADLMDATPIYDVKPYLEYVDSHVGVRSGFVDRHTWQSLEVDVPHRLAGVFSPEEWNTIRQLLAQDPRPHYHSDSSRVYGMTYGHFDIRFRVSDDRVVVLDVVSAGVL